MKSDAQNNVLNRLMEADPRSYTVYRCSMEHYPKTDVDGKLPIEHFPALLLYYGLTGDCERLGQLVDLMDNRGYYISESSFDNLGANGIAVATNFGSVNLYFDDVDYAKPFRFSNCTDDIFQCLTLLNKKLNVDFGLEPFRSLLFNDNLLDREFFESPANWLSYVELPYFADDKLESPSFLFAVNRVRENTSVDLLKELLVWATPEMIAKHGQLLPYKRVLLGKSGESDAVDLSALEYLDELSDEHLSVYDSFIYGLEGSSRQLDSVDQALLFSYASDGIRMGLGFTPDRILCRAPVDMFDHVTKAVGSSKDWDYLEHRLGDLISPDLMYSAMSGQSNFRAVGPMSSIYGTDALIHKVCHNSYVSELGMIELLKIGTDRLILTSSLKRTLTGKPAHPVQAMLYKELLPDENGLVVSIKLQKDFPNFITYNKHVPAKDSKYVFEYGDLWDRSVEDVVDKLVGKTKDKFFIEGIPTKGTPLEVFLAAQERGESTKADPYIFSKVLKDTALYVELLKPHVTGDAGWSVLADMVGLEALKPYYNELPRRLRVKVAGAQLQL
ncbi:hypothetical protein ACYPKM_01170 [Pseudomonas aeruginosa]